MLATTIQSVKHFNVVSFVGNSFYNKGETNTAYTFVAEYTVRSFTTRTLLLNLLFILLFSSIKRH